MSFTNSYDRFYYHFEDKTTEENPDLAIFSKKTIPHTLNSMIQSAQNRTKISKIPDQSAI